MTAINENATSENRDKFIVIRCTEDQRETVKSNAEPYSVSEFLLSYGLNNPVQTIYYAISDDQKEIDRRRKKIENNFNQIVQALNTDRKNGNVDAVTYAKTAELLMKLKEQLEI